MFVWLSLVYTASLVASLVALVVGIKLLKAGKAGLAISRKGEVSE